MGRVIFTGVLLILAGAVSVALFLRYRIVPFEGYPTWEAARNILIKYGEIVIQLPDDVIPFSAECDEPSAKVTIDGNSVITSIGYSWAMIKIEAKSKDKVFTYRIQSQKLNSWNRIRFQPINPEDPRSKFKKWENGVEKSHEDITRITSYN